MQDKKLLKELDDLEQEVQTKDVPALSELRKLNKNIESLIDLKENESTSVEVVNPEEFTIDLEPLKSEIKTLNDTLVAKDVNIDLGGVQRLLEGILSKEQKDIDLSELKITNQLLDTIVFSIQNIAGQEKEDLKPTLIDQTKQLEVLSSLLNAINENIVGIDVPEFDYKELERIIKKHLNISVSGGGSSGFIKNVAGTIINPATEEKQDTIIAEVKTTESLGNGQKTITTAGTAEALSTSTIVKSVGIKALSTNTGIVYVGDSGVSSSNGYELEAGDSIDLDVGNLADVYLDVATNGEGVSYIYLYNA